jgi:hypothetical protein
VTTQRQAPDDAALARQRKSARRNALLLGAVALAIYAAFILSGVLRAAP